MPKTALQTAQSVLRSTYKQDTRGPKTRQHDLAILEEQIDGSIAAMTCTKELTDQARFDHGYA